MERVDLSDQEFSEFLNKIDPNWTWESFMEYNRFMAKGQIIALVRYKNDAPLARWIWINKSKLNHKKENEKLGEKSIEELKSLLG